MVEVVRGADGDTWEASTSGSPAGRVLAWRWPDHRTFVFFREVAAEAYGPLLTALDRDLGVALHTSVDLADEQRQHQLRALGFQPGRQESVYEIVVADALDAVGDAPLPDGYALEGVLEVPERDLRELDDRLRQGVPGTDGWTWDEQGFHDETYGSGSFDPQLYWIAVHEDTGERVGIVRVWDRPQAPRLGLIAVLASHRRRGIARALLGEVFRRLGARGDDTVVTEIDDSNEASRRLLGGLGARAVGASVELIRPAPDRDVS
jgi:ribosomal protein S18 acetylase RimI-like enzyme